MLLWNLPMTSAPGVTPMKVTFKAVRWTTWLMGPALKCLYLVHVRLYVINYVCICLYIHCLCDFTPLGVCVCMLINDNLYALMYLSIYISHYVYVLLLVPICDIMCMCYCMCLYMQLYVCVSACVYLYTYENLCMCYLLHVCVGVPSRKHVYALRKASVDG